MPLVIVAIGVILLLLLMIRFKMNGFIALVLVALAVGLMQGMPLDKVIGSIKAGVGGTLGSLALIMGFGAMLGKMLADCGGAQRIATTLIAKFGKKHIQWAVVLTGFTVGFALFYEVGFVLMLPLVFTIAASANIPLLYVVEYMLQSQINPQLAGHGGRVSLMEITEDGYAILQFGGGCNGCSMVDVTLKEGIEKQLLNEFPELKGVRDLTEHQRGEHSYY